MSCPKTSPVFRKTPAPGPGFAGGPANPAGHDWGRTTRKPLLLFLLSGLLLLRAAQRREETSPHHETKQHTHRPNSIWPFSVF